jgi:nucleoid-associated protein Lsr2
MATRTVRTIVDDFDGSTEGIGTYRFSLEDVGYEIDLSADNRDLLRAALAPFIAAGRRLPKTAKAKPRGNGYRPTAALRAWWADNEETAGLPAYRTHGPIPAAVHDAYRAATSSR